MVRSFIAVNLAAGVVERLNALRRELSALDADVRWVREEGLHCTLKFLGEVEEPRLAEIEAVLRAALASVRAFPVRSRGVGVFPSWREPRIVWAGLQDGDAAQGIVALAREIEAAVEPLGFAREKRALHPHVTLGRVRSKKGWKAVEQRMRAEAGTDFGVSRTEQVVLYRSQLGRGGSVYSPLAIVALAPGA